MNVETEIKRGRKFDQVIEGAARVFMAEGFEGASVDIIAKEAGVSKATLYSYFPDKKLLFLEVARQEIERQAGLIAVVEDDGMTPREVMTEIGMSLCALILSKFGMSVFRVVIAEAERFPEVGKQFYLQGPAVTEQRMVSYFKAAEARGQLRIDDPKLAAHQFAELCKADYFFKVLLGLQSAATPDEIKRVVDGAVDMFLARYAV